MRTGIFGGSFDPCHNDHIKILNKFIEFENLDRVIVVPSNISPFKNGAFVSGKDRVNMLALATKSLKNVEISPFEIEREGKSYTFETILEIKKKYPMDELFLLIGADNLETFEKWKNPEIILENCTLTVAGRGGYNFEKAKEKFFKNFGNIKIETFSFDGDISSSYVRELLKLGIFDNGYINEKVAKYIEENNLYSGDNYCQYLKKVLKRSRLIHTAGVALTAKKLAKQVGEDENKAHLAGLLHDVAKYMDHKNYPLCVLPEGIMPNIIHQYLGAYVSKNILNITDEDILNAINYHTTGRPGMSTLEKIVFVADLIEPSRNYDEAEMLRKAVFSNFESGFKLCLKRLVSFLKKGGEPIFSLTLETAEYYGVL